MNDSSIQAKRRNAAFDRLEGLWLTNCEKLSSVVVAHACEAVLGLEFTARLKVQGVLGWVRISHEWGPADRIAGSEEVQPDVKCDCGDKIVNTIWPRFVRNKVPII
jgi:hypothetical protein